MPAVFADKVCVVTGAASGLGREISGQLAASGASVVLADINEAGLASAVAGIVEKGGKAKPVRVDVTNSESVRSLIEGAAAELGRIDYLFNNAGAAIPGEIRDLDLEQWRRVIEINLFGEIYGIHYAYPIMIRQGFGHIVNTASGFGIAPGPLNSPYVASKFAIFGISHALAAEARAFGIDVSIVCPGYIETALIEEMNPVNADGKALRAQIPVPLVPVERAAQIVLAGVAKRRMVIAFPGYVRVLAFLHRFVPSLFARFSARQIEQFRKIRKVRAGERPDGAGREA
jgi:NAD(P)-dependent dehydrogenase (short-subunit alcohol dehydrogenase family)